MELIPATKSCFVCGSLNASGLRLRFETDGTVVRTRFVPQLAHVGFKNTIHGGLISTVLDEVMTWACAARTNRFSYCAELTVRFNRPVRPDAAVVVTGELVNNRRDRLFEARAEMRDEEKLLLASATGKYLPIAPNELAGMMDEFEGFPPGIAGQTA